MPHIFELFFRFGADQHRKRMMAARQQFAGQFEFTAGIIKHSGFHTVDKHDAAGLDQIGRKPDAPPLPLFRHIDFPPIPCGIQLCRLEARKDLRLQIK